MNGKSDQGPIPNQLQIAARIRQIGEKKSEIFNGKIQILNADVYTQLIIFLFVIGWIGHVKLLTQNKCPFSFAGNSQETVFSCGYFFPVYHHIVTETNRCSIISTGTPNFSKGYQVSENLPALYCRPGIR